MRLGVDVEKVGITFHLSISRTFVLAMTGTARALISRSFTGPNLEIFTGSAEAGGVELHLIDRRGIGGGFPQEAAPSIRRNTVPCRR